MKTAALHRNWMLGFGRLVAFLVTLHLAAVALARVPQIEIPKWIPDNRLPVQRVVEGFFQDPEKLPPPVQAVWKSVFFQLFDDKTYGLGTAFLVKKETHGKDSHLYFLTNFHNLAVRCPNTGPCPKSLMIQNVMMIDKDGLKMKSQTGVLPSFEHIAGQGNPDLALVKVVTNKDVESLTPVTIAQSCNLSQGEKVYSIGFPRTARRTAARSRMITNKNAVFKRWGEGVFIQRGVFPTDFGSAYFLETTVDSILGASGSPLLNSSGEVIGVQTGSASGKDNQYGYQGDEDPDFYSYQSAAVPCESIRDFLNRNGI